MKHVEKQPLFWPKNLLFKMSSLKINHFNDFFRFVSKMILTVQNMLNSGLKVLGSNCWDKTKENVFSDFYETEKIKYVKNTLLHKKTLKIFTMLLWFIGEPFWNS